MPPIKKKFQIPLTHLPPIGKKMPQIKKTFSNSNNTFAPNCKQMPPIKELLILDEWLPEQMSYGPYKEELTLCMLSHLRISGMLKIYHWCLEAPEQGPPLVY